MAKSVKATKSSTSSGGKYVGNVRDKKQTGEKKGQAKYIGNVHDGYAQKVKQPVKGKYIGNVYEGHAQKVKQPVKGKYVGNVYEKTLTHVITAQVKDVPHYGKADNFKENTFNFEKTKPESWSMYTGNNEYNVEELVAFAPNSIYGKIEVNNISVESKDYRYKDKGLHQSEVTNLNIVDRLARTIFHEQTNSGKDQYAKAYMIFNKLRHNDENNYTYSKETTLYNILTASGGHEIFAYKNGANNGAATCPSEYIKEHPEFTNGWNSALNMAKKMVLLVNNKTDKELKKISADEFFEKVTGSKNNNPFNIAPGQYKDSMNNPIGIDDIDYNVVRKEGDAPIQVADGSWYGHYNRESHK